MKPCPLCGQEGSARFLTAPDRFHGRKDPYHLVRCSACSLVWLENAPDAKEMFLHYGSDYHLSITQSGETSPAKWLKRREVVLQHKSSGALLDLGCSCGSFLKAFKETGWKLYGVEISGAQAKMAEEQSGAQVFVGDALEAPFPPETFDVVTCFHVLEHHYEPPGVLRQVWQWLKPGGIFYVLLPNIDSWEARLFGSYWYALELPRHLYHFSPKSFSRLAARAGFSVTQLSTRADSYIEHSIRYVFDDIASELGFSRAPLVKGLPPSFPLKVVRKMFRLTAEASFRHAARLAGAGASIEAIFEKTHRPEAPRRRAKESVKTQRMPGTDQSIAN